MGSLSGIVLNDRNLQPVVDTFAYSAGVSVAFHYLGSISFSTRKRSFEARISMVFYLSCHRKLKRLSLLRHVSACG